MKPYLLYRCVLIRCWSTVIILLGLTGCSAESYDASSSSAKVSQSWKHQESEPGFVSKQESDSNEPHKSSTSDSNPTVDRRIIYNCTLGIVVEDYESFESKLPRLVKRHNGFIAKSNTDRRNKENQSATWIIRVPASNYSDVLGGVELLGLVDSRDEHAHDVTEEFVDIEARIKTKKQLESRILKMLEERPGKLTDVLSIERELSRVREEVERMEGRIRFLNDQTSYATITINCREDASDKPIVAPTFAIQIKNSWSNSINSLKIVVQQAIIALVALAPWLTILCVIGLFFFGTLRRIFFKRIAA